MFKTNTEKAQEGNLKPEGNYEVIIGEIEFKTTLSGKEKIQFPYIIRNDVKQKYQNGIIYHSIWKADNPNEDDIAAEGYNYGQLMMIAKAAGLPKKADYDSFDAFLDALEGKPLRVELVHKQKGGTTYENIKKHYVTEYPDVKHVFKSKDKPSAAFEKPGEAIVQPDENDDDYPF